MKANLNLLFAGIVFLCFTSCKKETHHHDPVIDQEFYIEGMRLYTTIAEPFGQLGTPDVNSEDGDFQMSSYPIPCRDAMRLDLEFKNTAPLKINVKVVHVIYPDAPSSYSFQQNHFPIKIENQDSVGKIAMAISKDVDPAPMGGSN